MKESESPVLQDPSPKSRRYPEAFKRDAVCLVTDEKYTFKAAAQAVGVSEKSLRDWHKKFAPPSGATVWLAQQCKAGTRGPLLGKPGSGTRSNFSVQANSLRILLEGCFLRRGWHRKIKSLLDAATPGLSRPCQPTVPNNLTRAFGLSCRRTSSSNIGLPGPFRVCRPICWTSSFALA